MFDFRNFSFFADIDKPSFSTVPQEYAQFCELKLRDTNSRISPTGLLGGTCYMTGAQLVEALDKMIEQKTRNT